jgi:hypothetical protein
MYDGLSTPTDGLSRPTEGLSEPPSVVGSSDSGLIFGIVWGLISGIVAGWISGSVGISGTLGKINAAREIVIR